MGVTVLLEADDEVREVLLGNTDGPVLPKSAVGCAVQRAWRTISLSTVGRTLFLYNV